MQHQHHTPDLGAIGSMIPSLSSSYHNHHHHHSTAGSDGVANVVTDYQMPPKSHEKGTNLRESAAAHQRGNNDAHDTGHGAHSSGGSDGSCCGGGSGGGSGGDGGGGGDTGCADAVAIPDVLLTELMDVYDELAVQRKNITRIMANVKKCYVKVEKRIQAQAAKPARREPRQSGLTKPFPVSDSLCTFMAVPEGTQLARAEVTKYLHRYIKENGLYHESNKQLIKPDLSLKQLLNINDTDEPLDMFSMQKRMNNHFIYTNCSV